MRTLKEFYETIQNPIEVNSVWDTIVEKYIKSHDEEDFKNLIMNCVQKEKSEFVESDKEYFYAAAMNAWKKRISSLEEEQINSYLSSHFIEEDFLSLKEVVRQLSDIYSIDQLKSLLTNATIMRYFSRYLSGDEKRVQITTFFDKKQMEDLKYALYVNIEPKHLYSFLTSFLKECAADNFDYTIHFKEQQSDAMVCLYVKEEEIDLYCDILNRIRKENVRYFANVEKPSILLGVIKDWIGIGSASPLMKKDYFEQRFPIVLNAFDKVLYDYISHHIDMTVSYKAERYTVREYLCMFVANYQVDKIQNGNHPTIKLHYYSYQEVDKLRKKIQNQLLNAFDQIFTTKMSHLGQSTISVSLENGEELEISVDDFRFGVRKLFLLLLFKDKSLLDIIKKRIHNECSYFDIDPEKFCFDKETYEQMHYQKPSHDKGMVEEKVKEMKNVATMLEEIETIQTKNEEFTMEERDKISKNLKSVHQIFQNSMKE